MVGPCTILNINFLMVFGVKQSVINLSIFDYGFDDFDPGKVFTLR